MKIAYTHCILLDGNETMVPQQDVTVLTDGDKITSIIPANRAELHEYEIVDLHNQYLMPGLINLHVHIPATGKPKKKPTDAKKLVHFMTSNVLTRKIMEKLYQDYARIELMSGVTTFRSVGGVENYDSKLRDKINRGKVQGPRILAGNMAISVPGGHMAGSLAYEATSVEEAASLVRTIAVDHPDLIKLMITGGVLDAKKRGEPGVVKMKPEIVKAACEEAHKLGLPVAAHVESKEGLRIALQNGVDTIEHGAVTDEEIIQLFKEKKAVHVATLSPALPYALFPMGISHCNEMAQYNGRIVFEGIIACAKACLANHIPVGLGTDTGCPYITHYDMWRELQYYTKFCGVSNTFALYTATKLNAQIAGIGNVTGTIEAGKCADFIVTKRNPLENLEALREISMVVTHGKRIEHPKVKKMSQVERELDHYI